MTQVDPFRSAPVWDRLLREDPRLSAPSGGEGINSYPEKAERMHFRRNKYAPASDPVGMKPVKRPARVEAVDGVGGPRGKPLAYVVLPCRRVR